MSKQERPNKRAENPGKLGKTAAQLLAELAEREPNPKAAPPRVPPPTDEILSVLQTVLRWDDAEVSRQKKKIPLNLQASNDRWEATLESIESIEWYEGQAGDLFVGRHMVDTQLRRLIKRTFGTRLVELTSREAKQGMDAIRRVAKYVAAGQMPELLRRRIEKIRTVDSLVYIRTMDLMLLLQMAAPFEKLVRLGATYKESWDFHDDGANLYTMPLNILRGEAAHEVRTPAMMLPTAAHGLLLALQGGAVIWNCPARAERLSPWEGIKREKLLQQIQQEIADEPQDERRQELIMKLYREAESDTCGAIIVKQRREHTGCCCPRHTRQYADDHPELKIMRGRDEDF